MTNNNDDAEATPVYPQKSPGREEILSEWIPESDDWEAKTFLDLSDPAAVAALRQMGEMYPEVDDLQPLIDDFLGHFLKSRTSVLGKARQEIKDVLVGWVGGQTDEDKERAKIFNALAGDLDDD